MSVSSLAMALRPRRVATALLGLVALAFAVGSWRIGFWTDDGPGPGLLPFGAALLLAALLVLFLREPSSAEETPFTLRGIGAIGLLVGYAFTAPPFGFVVPTVLFVFLWAKAFHGVSVLRALVLAGCLTAAGVLVFGILLKVPTPLWPAWS